MLKLPKVAPKLLQVADVPIKYQQGENPLCFAKSMASALFYVDLKGEAGDINNIAIHFSNKLLKEACKAIQEYMRIHVLIIGQCQLYNYNKWRTDSGNHQKKVTKMTIEDLVNNKTIYPTLVVPIGNDGSTGHTVSVMNDLILILPKKMH